jgi:hypothetical protein
VSKPAAQLEEELETTDDDDDEDLILCRYSVAECTGVSGYRLRILHFRGGEAGISY